MRRGDAPSTWQRRIAFEGELTDVDARGARHLSARIAAGAAVGERVEVVWVSDESVPVQPGEAGTVVSIDEGVARVAFDGGAELAVDAGVVRLRALRRSA